MSHRFHAFTVLIFRLIHNSRKRKGIMGLQPGAAVILNLGPNEQDDPWKPLTISRPGTNSYGQERSDEDF